MKQKLMRIWTKLSLSAISTWLVYQMICLASGNEAKALVAAGMMLFCCAGLATAE